MVLCGISQFISAYEPTYIDNDNRLLTLIKRAATRQSRLCARRFARAEGNVNANGRIIRAGNRRQRSYVCIPACTQEPINFFTRNDHYRRNALRMTGESEEIAVSTVKPTIAQARGGSAADFPADRKKPPVNSMDSVDDCLSRLKISSFPHDSQRCTSLRPGPTERNIVPFNGTLPRNRSKKRVNALEERLSYTENFFLVDN